MSKKFMFKNYNFSIKIIILSFYFVILIIIFVFFVFQLFALSKINDDKNFMDFDNTLIYEKKLQNWKDQCFFKPEKIYTGEQIRKKLSRNNKNIYFLHKKVIVKNLDDQRTGLGGILYTNSDTLIYSYIDGIFDDAWYLDTSESAKPNYFVSMNAGRTNLLFLGSTINSKSRIKFFTYADTTPPPIRPNN